MVYVFVLDQFTFWPKHNDQRQGEDVSWVSPGFLGNGDSSAAQAIMLSGPRCPIQPHAPLLSSLLHSLFSFLNHPNLS